MDFNMQHEKNLDFIKKYKTVRYRQHFLTFPIDCSIMFTKPFKLLWKECVLIEY